MRFLGRAQCALCRPERTLFRSARRASLSVPENSPQGGRRRVVVTGTGMLTCLGVGTRHVWKRLINGESGITALDGKEYAGIPCRVAGRVPLGASPGELHLEDHVTRADRRLMSLGACYSVVAADEALQQAGWAAETEAQRCYTGVAVGAGLASIEEFAAMGHSFVERGYSKVSPFMLTRILGNMPAGQISIRGTFKGPNHSVTTACATGSHAIGDAFRFIRHGDARVMVTGSTEASVTPLAIAAFARIRALCTDHNEAPSQASRPFDMGRSGFVMGEGAGIMVLEDLEHAQARGATILAEVLGYGLTGDGHHITAPSETGEGALRCMQMALRDAGLDAADLGHINAHATSTPLGDAAESRAVTALLGAHRANVGVSSTKGALGHLQGGAGSVEAILAVMACAEGVMPPTLNCENPDPEFDLNYVPLKAQPWPSDTGSEQKVAPGDTGRRRRVALSNSFGFGGTNASLCIGEWEGS